MSKQRGGADIALRYLELSTNGQTEAAEALEHPDIRFWVSGRLIVSGDLTPAQHRKTAAGVHVHGLNYIVRHVNSEDSLLIVDDVYDSGRSIRQVITDLREECRKNTPDIRIATIFRKPASCIPPDVHHHFLHDTDRWLVFPHELSGLSLEEILAHKPGIDVIRDRLLIMRQAK